MTETNANSDFVSSSIDYTTATPRFSVLNDDALNDGIAYLNEHGYAVISYMLNQDEINLGKDLLWKFLENCPTSGKIRRDDPDTWSNDWPCSNSFGVIEGSGIGQSEFLWYIRSNPLVKKVFARIWSTRQLLVSFDGCNVFRDWRYNPAWKTKGGWNHVDQNPITKPDRYAFQGFISLNDQNEKTGGLIVYPNTHLRFNELTDAAKDLKGGVKVSDTHPIMNQGKTPGKLVHCRAGDLILRDGRTVHCNSPATVMEERKVDEPVGLLRIIAYVSMSPITLVRDQTLDEFREKRKQLVEKNCTCGAYSAEIGIKGDINTGLPKVSFDKFNAYQKALILGLEDSDEE